MTWPQQAAGGSSDDGHLACSISALADGSSLITGHFQGTASFGSTTLTSAGSDDVFIAKLNADGSYAWAQQAGGSGTERGNGISALADGSSLITGDFYGTASFGSTTLTSAGANDVFIAKLNADGSWAREYIQYDPLNIAEDVVSQWFSQSAANSKVRDLTDPRYLQITASSWSESIRLVSVGQAATAGDRVDATQIDFGEGWQGSVLNGADNGDVVWGRAGWDVLDGADGNDLLRAGNGRDILIGGPGEDELHGDFGWNTYRSEVDGYSDLIAIKSDEHMIEGYSGTAGHNPNGEKCDIIEGLDSNDEIIIIGVESNEITVRNNASAHGETGIGIYADGALEGLYTGGDLSVSQIRRMTTGVLEIEPHGFRAEWDAIV